MAWYVVAALLLAGALLVTLILRRGSSSSTEDTAHHTTFSVGTGGDGAPVTTRIRMKPVEPPDQGMDGTSGPLAVQAMRRVATRSAPEVAAEPPSGGAPGGGSDEPEVEGLAAGGEGSAAAPSPAQAASLEAEAAVLARLTAIVDESRMRYGRSVEGAKLDTVGRSDVTTSSVGEIVPTVGSAPAGSDSAASPSQSAQVEGHSHVADSAPAASGFDAPASSSHATPSGPSRSIGPPMSSAARHSAARSTASSAPEPSAAAEVEAESAGGDVEARIDDAEVHAWTVGDDVAAWVPIAPASPHQPDQMTMVLFLIAANGTIRAAQTAQVDIGEAPPPPNRHFFQQTAAPGAPAERPSIQTPAESNRVASPEVQKALRELGKEVRAATQQTGAPKGQHHVIHETKVWAKQVSKDVAKHTPAKTRKRVAHHKAHKQALPTTATKVEFFLEQRQVNLFSRKTAPEQVTEEEPVGPDEHDLA